MAEGIANQLIENKILMEARISSAGSSAMEGSPASKHAVAVASSHDIDIGGHRARLLNATMVRGADLIVTMGERHRHTVGVLEPSALDYTVRLTDFCDHVEGDVFDPIGGDLETYKKTFDVIAECIERMASALPEFDGWRARE
jgi:protein-tyrosine-phosphatase